MNTPSSGRLLAINIRTARIGYVLFDGSKRLLDWGTRNIPTREGWSESRRMRVISLVDLTMPSAIVLCGARRKRDVSARGASRIAASVLRQAALAAIPCSFVGTKGRQRVFLAFGVTNKYEMASAAAGVYPEISWKVPFGRRRWQTEPRVMLIFDALIAGLAYWQRSGLQEAGVGRSNISHP